MMVSVHLRALAYALLGLVVVASEEIVQYDIILDAGSTGTRMYLFTSTLSWNEEGEEVLKVATKKIGKKKPGLSAYATNPGQAVAPLLELFSKVKSEIPESLRGATSVSVLGTAGMRSVEATDAQAVYDAVREGLSASDKYAFSKGDLLKLRSLTGAEEGMFSLVCVNFLTGRLGHHMNLTKKGAEENLLGILDLGGSSTQIAVPSPPDENKLDAALQAEKVRSFAAYGMEQMRERADKRILQAKQDFSPCYFKGYKEPKSALQGSGKALECRKLLEEILEDARRECTDPKDKECVPGSEGLADKDKLAAQQFYAVSGYLYVTDFASHWLTTRKKGSSMAETLQTVGNRPTIQELTDAADDLCTSDWTEIETAHAGGAEAGAHRYTDSTKAPHRCLEANYVVMLLHHSYGFPREKRFVTFEDEVDGNDVEWPLGALLHMKHQARLDARHGTGALDASLDTHLRLAEKHFGQEL